MTLHEAAKALGVETRHDAECLCDECEYTAPNKAYRPNLEIAHEVLAKLPWQEWALEHSYSDSWRWYTLRGDDSTGRHGYGTFLECVLALAERYLKERGT